MTNLKKYALITGATSGIGYELAKLFAKDQYNLVIVARHKKELDEKATEFRQFGVNVYPFVRDLFKREEAFALCEDVRKMGIPIEILVNNAGQGLYGEFKDTDIFRELSIIDLNTSSVVILTKFFLKEMLKRNSGKILNVASVASKTPGPLQSVYHGTKAFLLSFSEALIEEIKDSEITITALMPGVTDTDFFRKAEMLESKAVEDKDSMADPADVAKDGYEALMSGSHRVISGFKNKMQIGLSNIMPDSMVAHTVYEQEKPKEKSEN